MTEPGPGLPVVHGHEELLGRIRAAIANGRMPQSLLLYGSEGVGKRTLALWAATTLHCESDSRPCGTCRSCRLAGRLEHPDIHFHFPMPRPKRAGSKKKLRDTIEAQRQERLGQLRATPETRLDEGEVTGIYLTAVENIRSQASRRPAMGRIAVFIVAEADRMVPQTASPEAANAFLKLLEEPPDFAYLILTTSRPQALLPTIRSRTAGLRVAPLTDADVERFLIEDRGLAQGDARTVARRAEGSIGRALGLTSQTDDASALTADRLLAAALRADPGSRYTTAGQFTAQGARSILAPALEELEERLRDVLCYASGATDLARDPGKSARILERWPVEESAVLAALAAVERAREDAHRNLNPQATVSVLLADMSVALGTR
jgi:DNA polymerase-3 subunit delta'